MKTKDSVEVFLEKLDHPYKKEIITLRKIILGAGGNLAEHIKWNAPSFVFKGDDRITMKLFPPRNVQVVFHRGVSVKKQPPARLIDNAPGFIKWAANDRAVATFDHIDQINKDKSQLETFVKEWLKVSD